MPIKIILQVPNGVPGAGLTEQVMEFPCTRDQKNRWIIELPVPENLRFEVNAREMRRAMGGADNSFSWSIMATQEAIEAASKQLANAALQLDTYPIPVRRSGKGPTEQSCKVVVERVRSYFHDPRDRDKQARTHTLTVPVSQLVERDGQMYAPRWLLERTARTRLHSGVADEVHIDASPWPYADLVWNAFWVPLLAKAKAFVAEQPARLARTAELEARREAETAVRRAALDLKREVAAVRWAVEQRKELEKKQARMATLKTVEASSVSWKEWVEVRGAGGHYEERVHKNCTLKFSGQRVYVVLEDGREVIKTLKTIHWQQAEA